MKPIRTAIIDDEAGALSALRSIVEMYPEKLDLVGTANSVESGVEMLISVGPELLFLDIQLKRRKGFELLDLGIPEGIEVIFVTAFDTYAIQAFKHHALAYLLKPVAFDEFELAVERAAKMLRPTALAEVHASPLADHRITLPREHGVTYLVMSDLIMIQAEGSYCRVYTVNNEPLLISKPLKFIEAQVDASMFVRCHRSYLVNVRHILHWKKGLKGKLSMTNGHSALISREGKKLIQDHFQKS